LTNKCLGFVVTGSSIGVGPVSDQLQPTNLGLARPYDNLGIPGATAGDLVNITSANPSGNTANQFAYAILRNNGPAGNPFNGTNAIQQGASLQPNLTTLWVGNNDVLGALLYAVAIDGVTLTPVASFNQSYTTIIQTIQSTGSTIVTLNIPDVGSVPFANTIPPVVIDPSTGLPLIVGGQTVPLLGPGDAAYPCPGGAPACPLPSGTLVTLSAQALLQTGRGIPCAVALLPQCNMPLPDGAFIPPATIVPGVLLYPDEVDRIRTRTDELNGVIATVGGTAGALPLDIHEFFTRIAEDGYHIGGLTLTTTFGTGGIFSADGFHPNNVGQAVVAAEIIKLLNSARDLDIRQPNLAEPLFTPDLPPGGAAVTAGPGIGLSEEAQQQLYAMFPPVGADVQVLERLLPIRRPGPRARGGETRTVERPGDRNQ
jgi:lysophospholipase L1-like esterase